MKKLISKIVRWYVVNIKLPKESIKLTNFSVGDLVVWNWKAKYILHSLNKQDEVFEIAEILDKLHLIVTTEGDVYNVCWIKLANKKQRVQYYKSLVQAISNKMSVNYLPINKTRYDKTKINEIF